MEKKFAEKFIYNGFSIKICSVVAAFVVICLISAGCQQNKTAVEVEDITITQQENDGINVGNDGVNAGIAGDADDVTIVSQGKAAPDEMVALSLDDAGRTDPFLPSSDLIGLKLQSSAGYDLLPPPDMISEDESASQLISTKVSGIMYDSINPSAILNINDTDYLVKAGDIINNYKVLYITKNYVTVQHGSNIYKAGVGELISRDLIQNNTVPNLETKFGGNRRI